MHARLMQNPAKRFPFGREKLLKQLIVKRERSHTPLKRGVNESLSDFSNQA
jgi:hypothetical protein